MPLKNFALVALILMAGCTPRVVQREFNPLSAEIAVHLISGLRTRAVSYSKVRGLADIELNAEGGATSTLRAALVKCNQNRSRFELLPEQGALSLALLVASDSSAKYLDRREQLVVESKEGAKVVASFLKIYLSPHDLIALLFGAIPQSIIDKLDPTKGEWSGDTYYLKSADQLVEVKFIADQTIELHLREPFRKRDSLVVRMNFSGESMADKGKDLVNDSLLASPSSIEVTELRSNASFKLFNFRQIKLEFECRETLFELESPGGYRILRK